MERMLFISSKDEMRLRIFHALDAPLETLSVDAICRNAKVSKPTFYRHFSSKYDIPFWICKFMCSFTLDEIGKTLTWEEGLKSYFAFGLQELEYLRLVRVSPEERERLNKKRLDDRSATIENTLLLHGVTIDSNLQSAIEGYIKIELHFAEERLDPQRTKNPESVAENVISFIPQALYDALKTPLEAGTASSHIKTD